MPQDMGGLIYTVSTWVVPVLLAITLHEAAHGFVAMLRGDSTAWMMGRVTLNPLKHIDPFGTVILPGLLILLGSSFLFGYAKPVPVNVRALRNPRWDSALVSAAGPGANILMAIIAALLLHVLGIFPENVAEWLEINCVNALRINVSLAIFNMLPVPPLDGGRVLASFLPRPLGALLERLEQYGMMIFIGIFVLLPMITARLGARFDLIDRFLGWATAQVIVFIAVITGHA